MEPRPPVATLILLASGYGSHLTDTCLTFFTQVISQQLLKGHNSQFRKQRRVVFNWPVQYQVKVKLSNALHIVLYHRRLFSSSLHTPGREY
jgi:hypothetical protein